MSLSVKRVMFRNFRSYQQLDLKALGALTIFVGPNAVGKTNIIEGIQLLTALTSFRHPTLEQMIQHGSPSARLAAEISDGHRNLDVVLTIQEGGKRYELNGKVKKSSELKGLVPSVAFTPDDLNMVKGPMSVRRMTIDSLGSQLTANYAVIKRDYEQVIRYKNRLLKDEAPNDLVDSINETLVTCGAQLTYYRMALFSKLAPKLRERYADITSQGETLDVTYTPSWGKIEREGDSAAIISRDEARRALTRALNERKDEERQRRRALVGPHTDQIDFFIDGMSASSFGSQGQQRTVVLASKLAEAAVIEEVVHQKPVLLLDDVMSELDSTRRRALMEYMAEDVQTFITTTNLSYFDNQILDYAQVINLPLH